MNQKIIDLHDEYTRGKLDRREFLRKLAVTAGGTAAASAVLPLFEDNYANAQIVNQDDPRLNSGYITYPTETTDMRAYRSRLKGNEKLPGVVVIHENRGLNPHIEDVSRRMALEGFYSIAPDALSPLGGTPEDTNQARSMFSELDSRETVNNFVAAVKYLNTHPQTTGKVGVVGFCWGGAMTNQVAVNSPVLAAAVPYYGRQPAVEDVPKIKASMLLQYAGNDTRINEGISAYEAALKKAGIDYKTYIYEGAGHAFNNDTGTRYHKEAAQLAWGRTIAFFKEKLIT
ncbi:dienelactone hydrolase family protein [candidate division KSB1 bacterium]